MTKEKVGTSSFSTVITLQQKQQAAREEVGEVNEGEDLPGQPGVQLHANCGEPLLADRGDDGDAQLTRMMKKTQWNAQEW